jgi:hypothetical protein
MQLRCGVSIARVEGGGGPKCGKGGLGAWGLGSLENCKCHTHHVYRYYRSDSVFIN